MRAEPLSTAIRIATENPFVAAAVEWSDAIARLRESQLAGFVGERLERGDLHGAKLAVLALAHAQACVQPDEPKRLLDERVLPARLLRRLPRPRHAYVRIAAASGRCYRALNALEGHSAAMQQVRRETWAACFGESLYHALVLERVVRDHDVLVLGETGTGKESVAHAIQEGTPGQGDGKPAPRAVLNAAAVPETLVESELFGHAKGAFTGAATQRVGRIRSAADGCFFLDEIGDLNTTAQVKLLRVMETDIVSPLGSDESHAADVRWVAATHRDLAAMVARGEFRHDLYQRVAGNVIRLPALRERPEDIVDIGLAFAERHLPREMQGRGLDRLRRWLSSHEARRYPWPGNVRELQNALRNLMLGLEPAIGRPPVPETASADELPPPIRDASASLDEASVWYARRVVARSSGNLSQAARVLGVDRATLRRRLARS